MKTAKYQLTVKRACGWVRVNVTVVRDNAGALVYRIVTPVCEG